MERHGCNRRVRHEAEKLKLWGVAGIDKWLVIWTDSVNRENEGHPQMSKYKERHNNNVRKKKSVVMKAEKIQSEARYYSNRESRHETSICNEQK